MVDVVVVVDLTGSFHFTRYVTLELTFMYILEAIVVGRAGL